MKVFFYGFWPNFLQPSGKNEKYFIELLEKVFDEKITLGTFDESELLFESVFSMNTLLYHKKWKHTFLFSGESDRRVWNSILVGSSRKATLDDYSCILKGEKNNKNIINLPLFVYYDHLFQFDYFKNKPLITTIPPKDVCVIISNANDSEGRNHFCEKLEQKIKIDYAGNYKNNVPRLEYEHCTKEFNDFVSQYKFIITMENSKNETYITEKILHGFSANTIPVYWGSDHITDYFNEDRFVNVKNFEKDTMNAIERIVELANDGEKYLEMVNQPIYVNTISMDDISRDIKKLLQV